MIESTIIILHIPVEIGTQKMIVFVIKNVVVIVIVINTTKRKKVDMIKIASITIITITSEIDQKIAAKNIVGIGIEIGIGIVTEIEPENIQEI